MNSLYTKKDGIASFYFAFALYMVAQLVIGMALLSVPADSFVHDVIYALLPLSIFAIAWWYAKVSQKDFVKATTADVKPPLAHTLWGCLATFGLIHMMLPINELFLDWFENMGLNRPTTELDMSPVALVLMTVVLAPIGEEFLFRGTVGRGLANDKPILGILLSGGLFALFHLNPAQTLHQFVLGSFLMLRLTNKHKRIRRAGRTRGRSRRTSRANSIPSITFLNFPILPFGPICCILPRNTNCPSSSVAEGMNQYPRECPPRSTPKRKAPFSIFTI